MKITNNKIIKNLITAVFWLILWQIVYIIVDRDVLVASPVDTFNALFQLAGTTAFYKTITMSFLRITLGFALGIFIGCIIAALTCCSKTICMLLNPAINVIKSTPVASFIIIALAWMKSNEAPVFISFIATAPIVWANISGGIKSTDIKLIEMAKMFEYTALMKLKKIYLPAILPYFRSAVAAGAGLAWKSGVAAEVIGNPKFSLGSKLYDAKVYLETPQLFAWTAIIIMLSVIFEKLIIKFVSSIGAEKGKSHEKNSF